MLAPSHKSFIVGSPAHHHIQYIGVRSGQSLDIGYPDILFIRSHIGTVCRPQSGKLSGRMSWIYLFPEHTSPVEAILDTMASPFTHNLHLLTRLSIFIGYDLRIPWGFHVMPHQIEYKAFCATICFPKRTCFHCGCSQYVSSVVVWIHIILIRL